MGCTFFFFMKHVLLHLVCRHSQVKLVQQSHKVTRYSDNSPTDAQVHTYHVQTIPWVAAYITVPRRAHCCLIATFDLRGHSLTIKTHENHVKISIGCKQDVLCTTSSPPTPLQHGILLVLQTVGHIQMDNVIQQDDAEFS